MIFFETNYGYTTDARLSEYHPGTLKLNLKTYRNVIKIHIKIFSVSSIMDEDSDGFI